MWRPENDLDDYERRITAERILSDAELIKRGATVSAAGTLVLGSCQAEYMDLYNGSLRIDPVILINEAKPEASPVEAWLNTAAKDALTPRYESPKDIPQPLRHMSQSLREVLVMGRSHMDSSAMRNVGKKSINVLGTFIAENDFGLEWKDQPTPEDVAHICQRLAQVTSRVLRLGMNFYNWDYTPSVLEVVKMPLEDRQHAWSMGQLAYPHAYFNSHIQDRLFNVPEIFAARFEAERRLIESSHKD